MAFAVSLEESFWCWAVFAVLVFYQELSFTHISLLHRPLGSAAHAHLVRSAVCVGARAALLTTSRTKSTPLF